MNKSFADGRNVSVFEILFRSLQQLFRRLQKFMPRLVIIQSFRNDVKTAHFVRQNFRYLLFCGNLSVENGELPSLFVENFRNLIRRYDILRTDGKVHIPFIFLRFFKRNFNRFFQSNIFCGVSLEYPRAIGQSAAIGNAVFFKYCGNLPIAFRRFPLDCADVFPEIVFFVFKRVKLL